MWVFGVQAAWPAEFGAAGSLRDGFLTTHFQNLVYTISTFLLLENSQNSVLCRVQVKPKSCFKGNKLRVEFGYLLELGWVGLLWDQLRSDQVPNDLRLAGSEFSMHTYLVEFNSSAAQSQCPVTRPSQLCHHSSLNGEYGRPDLTHSHFDCP